jgi:methionyl-tRNA formyltransferase
MVAPEHRDMAVGTMNFAFLGSSQFGMRCLQSCLQLPNIDIVGIVTTSQTFKISYRPEGVTNVLHADIGAFAQSLGIPVRVLQRSMNEPGLFETVASWKPDALLVAGWYHMVPRNWRNLAPAYGLHASLLPDYSGGAPLVWALINGEPKTGITLFQMDDGVDSGPIAGQKEEVILPSDTIATLYARIEERGLELLRETIPKLANGTLELRVQKESVRRVFPQRGPEDGWVDWNQDAITIERFIRAQTRPYPGAFTSLNGKPLHLWQASIEKNSDASVAPGTVMRLNSKRYLVSCGKAAVELHDISYENKTFSQDKLSKLLVNGGQMLGGSPNCLKKPGRN